MYRVQGAKLPIGLPTSFDLKSYVRSTKKVLVYTSYGNRMAKIILISC